MMEGENEWTNSIRNQIRRLTRLTEKLVFLSRMDEENSVLEMADFSLSDAVLDTAEPFLPELLRSLSHRTFITTVMKEP